MSGGEGTILGTIIGAFIISTLTNGLRILSVPQEWQMVVTGAIVIFAVYVWASRYWLDVMDEGYFVYLSSRVLAGDLAASKRFGEGRRLAQEHAVAVDPLARHAIEPLGDVHARKADLRPPARLGRERHAGVAEAVLSEGVTVAPDGEEDRLPHEARLVEGDPAAAVRHEDHPVDRLQFHERHAAPRRLVDGANAEARAGLGGATNRQAEPSGGRGAPSAFPDEHAGTSLRKEHDSSMQSAGAAIAFAGAT